MMKRILLVSPMPPWIGGVSVSSQRLYENLKRDGYDVAVYKLKFNNPALNNNLCIILRFFFIPFYVISHKKYDIIHCHVPGIYRKLYLGCFKFLYKKARLIFTIHGDIEILLNSKLGCITLNRADKIICVQMGDSQKVPFQLQYKCIDIPAFIFPNRISEKNIPNDVLNFVKYGEEPLVIFNGAVVLSNQYYDLYGFNETINAYKQLRKENIQYRLLMLINNQVVSKQEKDFIEKIKRQIDDDPFVFLIENGRFELLPLLRYARIYLRPTKTDGDSLSVREALAMNCSVIASDKAKRPLGTIVYHTYEELLKSLKLALQGQVVKVKDNANDFYNKIVEQYETI